LAWAIAPSSILKTKPLADLEIGPITASLIGIAKGADPEAYKKHLIEKYLK
jgi:hypothetical protein